MRKELENRLVKLSLAINGLCKVLDNSFFSQHLTMQIIRSSTSAALNYGEAQAAESRKDFIHKTSIVLKELKETKINLKLLASSVNNKHSYVAKDCYEECDHLIAIFHKTVISARKRKIHRRQRSNLP